MSKQVTIVNHTHWDREWYFSDQDSLVLSSLLFTNTIKELEKHPHASFVLDGQISILSDYLVAVELGHHIFDPCSKFIANLIGLTLEFSQN